MQIVQGFVLHTDFELSWASLVVLVYALHEDTASKQILHAFYNSPTHDTDHNTMTKVYSLSPEPRK